MSIQRNVIANYLGQLYAALIGIALVPLYVRYMGLEAYGLVGFYTMLQGWFMLLDAGLTPTMARETARCSAGATEALALRRLLRSLEGVFAGVGMLGALALGAAAGVLATRWLNLQQLEADEVRRAIALMALIVAMRWASGLYRAAITGLERFVWLNGFNITVATARFVLVLPFLAYVGATPTHFFAYQLAVAVAELACLAWQTYRLLPPAPPGTRVRWHWQPLRPVWRFASSAAFTAAVWVLVTQSDKLLLSGTVSLTDYAHFTLATLVASGIVMLSMPITGAIVPRLTSLHARHDEAGVMRLYRDATQVVAVVTVPIVLVLAVFPAQVLTVWTGRADVAASASAVLALYSVGNGVLALAAFPYYLQVARGDLSLHVTGNVIFVLIFLPLLVAAVSRFGMVGAGYAWLAANLLPFFAWLPVVHGRLVRGLHLGWLGRDIVRVASAPTVAAGLAWSLTEWPATRTPTVVLLITAYLVFTLLAAAGSSTVWHWLRRRMSAASA